LIFFIKKENYVGRKLSLKILQLEQKENGKNTYVTKLKSEDNLLFFITLKSKVLYMHTLDSSIN